MDRLSLYRGRPFRLSNDFFVINPTLDKIETIGMDEYMGHMNALIISTLDIADVLLVEQEVWYEDADDYKFFIERCFVDYQAGVIEDCDVLFINKSVNDALNFFLDDDYKFILVKKDDNPVLYDPYKELYFTEHFYINMVGFIKSTNMRNGKYEFLKGGNRKAKEYILRQDYKKRKRHENNPEKERVDLASIVSCLQFLAGKGEEIWDFPIYRVHEGFGRIQVHDNYKDTISALHAGCIDTKKNPVDFDKINWVNII